MKKNDISIICYSCKRVFTLDTEKTNILIQAKEKNIHFLMMNCPHCGKSFPINPITLSFPFSKKQAPKYKCPTNGCNGYVVSITDLEFPLGCGTCGIIWNNKKDLREFRNE